MSQLYFIEKNFMFRRFTKDHDRRIKGDEILKPFINLDEIKEFSSREKGKYGESCAGISEKIGAKKLGYSISIVPPGKRVCPFHNHHINEEMFLILEGSGTLRFGSEEYSIKKHDIIACPPGDRHVAHQIINTSDKPLRYLCLSTKDPYDICEYPDSDKILSYCHHENTKFGHVGYLKDKADYYEGEL